MSNLDAFVIGFALLGCSFNIWLLLRIVERQRILIAQLTRRVWILEGSPKCPECDGAELEA
jgi:hypothetical protein